MYMCTHTHTHTHTHTMHYTGNQIANLASVMYTDGALLVPSTNGNPTALEHILATYWYSSVAEATTVEAGDHVLYTSI